MSILSALLPQSFLKWVESETRSRVERIFGIQDRHADLAERELEARHKFTGLKPAKVKAIEEVASE